MPSLSSIFDERPMVWRECSDCYLFFKTEAGNGKRICPECELEQEAKERA